MRPLFFAPDRGMAAFPHRPLAGSCWNWLGAVFPCDQARFRPSHGRFAGFSKAVHCPVFPACVGVKRSPHPHSAHVARAWVASHRLGLYGPVCLGERIPHLGLIHFCRRHGFGLLFLCYWNGLAFTLG